ncbi:FAD-linked oxidoreductase [Pholiota molesta]|nr:FAD-linked oxidoreductase [Pholiota molesta]
MGRCEKSSPEILEGSDGPFPGSARIEDLDIILRDSSSADRLPLSPADIQHNCAHAREKGVKIIVDAEYSWYQPAIDALTLGLMREFNSRAPGKAGDVQPLVYATFQCYLRRTPEQLALAIEDSRKHNYSLGVKLVRGAYHPHELEAHRLATEFDNSPHAVGAPDLQPPVWREKRDTDYNYNECIKMLARVVKEDVDQCSRSASGSASVASVKGWYDWVKGTNTPTTIIQDTPPLASSPGIGVLFGTHNWRVSDIINYAFVLKYVPYGALAEVMPYLSRRAIENKSVLGEGAARRERQRAAQEIRKRIFG